MTTIATSRIALFGLVICAGEACTGDRTAEHAAPHNNTQEVRMQNPKHPMRAEKAFRRFLDERNIELAGLSPYAGVRSVLEFYRTTRFDTPSIGNHDMLMFQWGTYDWGDGQHFELDLTRQLIWPSSENEDEDEIWQLSLTFKFQVDDELRALGSGDRWCQDLSEVQEFEKYIQTSSALQAVAARIGPLVELSFGSAE